MMNRRGLNARLASLSEAGIIADYICVNSFNLPGRIASLRHVLSCRSRQAGPCSSAFYFIFLSSLLFVRCSSSVTTTNDSDYPLTNETAKAQTSQLSVKIPHGWFTATDNECNCIDLWLIKDDYSETLNFVPLNLDTKSSHEMGNDGLSSALQASKDFKIAKYGKSLKGFTDEEQFELNKKQFAAYQYIDDAGRNVRVVVFEHGSKFYEVSAVPLKTNNLPELYKIQNSVLSSIN